MITKIKYQLPCGTVAFSLIHNEFGRLAEVDAYIRDVALSTHSYHSTAAKAQDLKAFFDYIYEFPAVADDPLIKSTNARLISRTVLQELIQAYPEYLANGKDSTGIAGLIARRTKSKSKQSSTCARMLSTVSKFLEASAHLHADLTSLKDNGLISLELDSEALLEDLAIRRPISVSERSALLSKSMMANVISGGPRYSSGSMFKKPRTEKVGDFVEKAFPFDRVEKLITSATSYRDVCFWALLAGAGIRQSEAAQLLLQDVDPRTRAVFTIDPRRRPNAYYDIAADKRARLSWKGRDLETVYFLEPFKTIFFEHLPLYISKERNRLDCSHNFLFVTRSNKISGNPLFLADNKSLNDGFKRAQTKIGLDAKYTLHSLRHFYGVWCRNFIEVADGEYGLHKATVRKLMGHTSEKSTEEYAIIHRAILEGIMTKANTLMLKSKDNTQELLFKALSYRLEKAQEVMLGIR